ncbi:DUF5107 domain-containing protein [Catenulispora subtropica]|uniref:DUF5107 domain-containing protein n=1 Tax=Catenulispora subtropica TaxID=450798 RepID=A0ABN2R454_9ACTN
MSVLRLSSAVMPVAALGPENPLPPLRQLPDPRGGLDVSEADAEMVANLGYGHVESLLPYTFQDGYGRETPDRELVTAVLENDHLRAEFLLGYGGRLMSLRHKARGGGPDRELLFFPPKLQLANLGLRNAWFAGGVEWNLGTFGHTALTCSPLHAVRVTRDDGTPVLRMYEYERQRRLVYQLDCYLPAGSPALLVHVRIHNPFPEDAPVYWWSSAAVPQTPDSRALMPASSAYHFSYTGKMRRIPFPRWRDSDAMDCSYPGRVDYGADYFAEIPDGERRWIAAVDAAGRGLFQTSTDRMRGRKLFHWGTGSGGRNWQDWLSGPSRAYFEIQAGLARTQLEHLRLPGRQSWSWVEAYGPLDLDPERVRASWSEATAAAAGAIGTTVPASVLEDELARMTTLADQPPEQVLHSGSGWGALERRALGRNRALNLPGTPFPDATIGRDQQSWLSLVRKGQMPTPAPALPPSSYAVGPVWRTLLEKATSDPATATWFTWLHLGVNRYHANDFAGAREAWDRSMAQAETAWAHRNLAFLDAADGHLDAAADHCLRAHQLSPRLRPLTIETMRMLITAERPGEALEIVDRLKEPDRFAGRVLMLECRAALDAGDLVRARRILETGLVVDDVREGEDPLSDLWWEFHARQAGGLGPVVSQRVREEHPLPCSYDYSVRQL